MQCFLILLQDMTIWTNTFGMHIKTAMTWRWELPLRDQKGTKEYINTPKDNIFPRLEGSYFAGHGDFKSIPINP